VALTQLGTLARNNQHRTAPAKGLRVSKKSRQALLTSVYKRERAAVSVFGTLTTLIVPHWAHSTCAVQRDISAPALTVGGEDVCSWLFSAPNSEAQLSALGF